MGTVPNCGVTFGRLSDPMFKIFEKVDLVVEDDTQKRIGESN